MLILFLYSLASKIEVLFVNFYAVKVNLGVLEENDSKSKNPTICTWNVGVNFSFPWLWRALKSKINKIEQNYLRFCLSNHLGFEKNNLDGNRRGSKFLQSARSGSLCTVVEFVTWKTASHEKMFPKNCGNYPAGVTG